MYSDYDLRILREKRDEAQTAMQRAHADYREMRERRRRASLHLESRRRIEKLLAETSIPREIAECQRLLVKYLSEKELTKIIISATQEEPATLSAYTCAQAAYLQARDKAKRQYRFTLWVIRRYGDTIREILNCFGSVELVCRYNKRAGKLNVYFGGLEEPLGPGHAHWVVSRKGWVVCQRGPEKEIA